VAVSSLRFFASAWIVSRSPLLSNIVVRIAFANAASNFELTTSRFQTPDTVVSGTSL